ncbi:serine hydrolase domain-containing protein [Staphylococcus simulans]|uniref:serine hydrolase domain-containing protein n=1 Tax=Staphylococcus simulans TaxID=1286 RepID=UPI003F7D8DEF
MNRKILKIMIFVIAVALIAVVISYYLNWKHHRHFGALQHDPPAAVKKAKIPEDYKPVTKDPTLQYEQLDKYLKEVKFNGDIAVFHRGELVFDRGYGYQDFINDKKSNPNSMYLIGSAQKFMTGMMLKQLELDGKINMDDPVTKYLPWFETGKPLVLRDFMLHQSGIQKFHPKASVHSIDGAVHMLQEQGLQPNMFRVHQYNDANYIVLARVIEAVVNKPYAEYFNEKFVTPYHLDRTAFYNNNSFKPYMAKGYDDFKILDPPSYLDQYYGAGNLYMAPRDMGKLVAALQENKIFPKSVTDHLLYEVLTKDFPHAYRYGFYSYGGSGRTNGIFYSQQFTCYFNKEYILVMGTNYQKPVGQNEVYMREVFMHYLNQPDPTAFRKTIQ